MGAEEGRAIYANKNGIYFGGRSYMQLNMGDTIINPNKPSLFIAKLNFDLEPEWIKTFPYSGGFSEIFKITSDTEDNILVCGDYYKDMQVDDTLLEYSNVYYNKPFVMSIKELNPFTSNKSSISRENNRLILYPNPSPGVINIRYYSPTNEKYIFKVFNSIGQPVYSEILQGNFINNINLGAKAKGIYFIEVLAESDKIVRKVVID